MGSLQDTKAERSGGQRVNACRGDLMSRKKSKRSHVGLHSHSRENPAVTPNALHDLRIGYLNHEPPRVWDEAKDRELNGTRG